jgi:hypothetical protein
MSTLVSAPAFASSKSYAEGMIFTQRRLPVVRVTESKSWKHSVSGYACYVFLMKSASISIRYCRSILSARNYWEREAQSRGY